MRPIRIYNKEVWEWSCGGAGRAHSKAQSRINYDNPRARAVNVGPLADNLNSVNATRPIWWRWPTCR